MGFMIFMARLKVKKINANDSSQTRGTSSQSTKTPTFVTQSESAHLREVLEGLQADGPGRPAPGDAHLVLLHKARPGLALLPGLLVHQTD